MASDGRHRGGSLGFVIGLFVAVPATVFALSNLEQATVEFLGWQAEVPLWLVIGASVLSGAVIGVGVTLALQTRRRRERKKAAKAQVGSRSAETPTPDGTSPMPDGP